MATATQITIEQYLKTSYEPDAEFVNGAVEERNVGEYDHSVVQREILLWLHRHDKQWKTRTIQEQRTRLPWGNVRIPDVSVWARDVAVRPVFNEPQLIAIEVLSPEDRHSRVQERIEDYRRFGVRHIWVVDPVKRLGWECSNGNWTQSMRLAVEESPIYLDLDELFRELDEAEA
ncbi:MAG: Uma2 family endonuclease [Terracidiphilus sp.]